MFLLDCASLNHYNVVTTTIIIGDLELSLCAAYYAHAFTNTISIKLQNNPCFNLHFVEKEGGFESQ